MALRACKECGQKISSDAKACPHCGKQQAKSGLGCGGALGILILLGVIVTMFEHGTSPPPAPRPAPPPPSPAPKIERARIPHPKFHLYRQAPKEGIISVVVDRTTTDEQLKSLLWFFREKIRGQRLRELGLSQGYEGSGIIAVYRGDKCANEEFINELGPCGYGEHNDASYQWGISGDPAKDSGFVQTKDGNGVEVFNSSDNWQLPPDEQNRLQAGQKQRKDFALALSLSYQQEGLGVTAMADDTTLVLDSKDFETGSARRLFIQQLFADKKVIKQLCDSGFRGVRAEMFKGILSGNVGDSVSLGCR